MSNQLFLAFSSSSVGSNSRFFGINAVGTKGKVHELIYKPGSTNDDIDCFLKYQDIVPASSAYAVVLNKPVWSRGAASGANEHQLVIGCGTARCRAHEMDADESIDRLTARDLVRFALEFCKTSHEGLDLITTVLASHRLIPDSEHSGQSQSSVFILVDQSEAWILETAGQQWAAQCLKSGVRYLCGELTIKDKIDASSPGLRDYARERGWWSEDEPLNFTKAYGVHVDPVAEQQSERVHHLLTEAACGADMLHILRDAECSIPSNFEINSSQMSVMSLPGGSPACHWFTATPHPTKSLFKPFIFSELASLGDKTSNNAVVDKKKMGDEADIASGGTEHRHALWSAHEVFLHRLEERNSRAEATLSLMGELELNCLQDVSDLLLSLSSPSSSASAASSSVEPANSSRLASLFPHIVDLEMNFY